MQGAFEIWDDTESCRLEFASLTAPSAQSGIHKPSQVYVCWDLVESPGSNLTISDEQYSGMVLSLSQLPFIEPADTIYFTYTALPTGRPRMYDTESFAVHLLDLGLDDADSRKPVKVEVRFLEYEDIHPGKVKITGIEHVSGQIWAGQHSSSLEQPSDGQALEDGCDEDGGGHGHGSSSCDGTSNVFGDDGTVDMVSFLDLCVESMPRPGKKRKKQRPSTHAAEAQLTEASASDHKHSKGTNDCLDLEDPSLLAFLDETEIAELKSIQGICERTHMASDVSARRANSEISQAGADSDCGEEEDVLDAEVYTHDRDVAPTSSSLPTPTTSIQTGSSSSQGSKSQKDRVWRCLVGE